MESPQRSLPSTPIAPAPPVRRVSSGRGLKSVARSHYSSRSDDFGAGSVDGPTLSAAQVRQQTLSWTYAELHLATTPRGGDGFKRRPNSAYSSRGVNRSTVDEPRPSSAADPTFAFPELPLDPPNQEARDLLKVKVDGFARQEPWPAASNLSALSQLSLSIEQESAATDVENFQEQRQQMPQAYYRRKLSDAHGYHHDELRHMAPASPFEEAGFVERGLDAYDQLMEEQPLLPGAASRRQRPISNPHVTRASRGYFLKSCMQRLQQFRATDILVGAGHAAMVTPAVILALILNVLDAMSYGIIIFPPSDRMPNTTVQAGLALFLASTLVSQLTYTLGGSKFRGAVGSMMIEVMPFLHIFVRTIEAQMKDASDHAVLATIMCVFAMSTVLTGIVFGVLGYFRLGNLIQFFPRHILVGCIGGIGFFLMLTGIEVTTHISNEYSMHWVKRIFELYALKLWGGSLLLALFLKALQRRVHHPLFVPLFYVCIPIAFYAVVFIGRWPISKVREAGWLFSLPGGGGAPFYEFWKYFDFTAVQWSAIPATFPTQLALAFFGVLHVPINVPALAVSTHQDVDLNKELVGHGVSNLIAGLLGLPQNYLVYSNSLLYIRSGGDSLFGGLLLSLCTGLVWVAGGNFVEFVPTIVVGSLIFHLGIDLMKESLYDTWNTGMHSLEYMTILMIVVVMGVVGFTEGIGVGVVLACVFFVVMYSRKSVIRGTYSGTQLRSTVHRMYRQQCFLDQVGDQIRCIKLQGFMFFGTVNQLDEHIGQLLSESPRMRFLVFDFSLIYGIDYSAIESFHRIKRLLGDSNTHLVLAGVSAFSRILAQSGIFDEVSLVNEESVEVPVHSFDNINEALEWCENQLLTTYYEKYALQSASASAASIDIPDAFTDAAAAVPYSILTPRRVEVQQAASLILREAPLVHHAQEKEELLPVAILLQAFSDTGDCDDELLRFFEGRFQRVAVKSGTVLWLPGEDANELYIVEKGELVMGITESDAGRIKVVETLLPGTMVGELEMFCGRPRACRLIASDDSLLWSLTKEAFNAMSVENPQLVLKFVTKVALSFDAVRYHNTVYHYVR